MPEKIDIMNEVWKILLDWMRKQASQVLLLSAGIYGIWTVGTQQLQKQEHKINAQELRIESLTVEIRKCDAERASLSVEVTLLKQHIDLIIADVRRRK
jgi:hypothetical protein